MNETSKVEVKASGIHGRGLYARVCIAAGEEVIEYFGERIAKAESLRRCEAKNPFIFALDDEFDLDGNLPENVARWANHSCAANCEAQSKAGRIVLVARRGIVAGEEITFNYGYDLIDYHEHPCRCGTPECVGYIVGEEFMDDFRRRPPGASTGGAVRR